MHIDLCRSLIDSDIDDGLRSWMGRGRSLVLLPCTSYVDLPYISMALLASSLVTGQSLK